MNSCRVKLIKYLEHNRKPHAPGEIVTLPPDTAQWVVDQGAGEFVVNTERKSRAARDKLKQ